VPVLLPRRPGARGVGPGLTSEPGPIALEGLIVDLAGLGPFFAVDFHRVGGLPVPPWRPVGELLSLSEALRDRVAVTRAVLAARGDLAVAAIEPRVAASAVHLGIVARLTAPALGAAVLGRPLDLRPDSLWWQDVSGGPVPLSIPAPGRVPVDWERVLFDALLAPVTAAIARLVPVSSRVLWGNVASAVNSAAAQIARQRPDLADTGWQAAGRLFASPALRAERHPPGPGFRRASCCLFYRLAPGSPSAVCGDCILGPAVR
jgi:hypothetical protein